MNLIGKTIVGEAEEQEWIILRFSDGSAIKFQATREYGSNCLETVEELTSYEKWKVGIYTQEGYDAIVEKEKVEAQQARLAVKEAEYERLKKELGR